MNPQGQQESAPRPTSALCLDDASYVLGILTPAERQTSNNTFRVASHVRPRWHDSPACRGCSV